MPWSGVIVVGLVTAFVTQMVVAHRRICREARLHRGGVLPELDGAIGERLRAAERALLYFWSPTCGFCRSLTPRMRELASGRADVHLIDVAADFETARRLHIMATPTFVEIEDGRIVGVHVGAPPSRVLARFAGAGTGRLEPFGSAAVGREETCP